jgi:peptidylprolyl isomerase
MLILVACLALVIAGCGGDDDSSSNGSGGETTTATASPAEAAKRKKPKVEVPDEPAPEELVVEDLIEGEGREAKAGDEVTVNYVGVLYDNGKEFDASFGGLPFFFELGAGQVIPGWDQGIEGMKVGGRRELIIPPELAYGSQSAGSIPPNSTLVFVVDLLAIK